MVWLMEPKHFPRWNWDEGRCNATSLEMVILGCWYGNHCKKWDVAVVDVQGKSMIVNLQTALIQVSPLQLLLPCVEKSR